MALLCPTACGTASLVSTYFDCTDKTRKYGGNYFLLIKCDYQFTDITDPTEWQTAVTNGDIAVSPPGSVVVNAPDASSFVIEGCGREIVGEATYTVDFTTYQVGDNTNNVPDDIVYWRDLLDGSPNYRLVLLDCNEIFRMDDGWMDAIITAAGTPPVTISGANPGFEYSVTQIPFFAAGEEQLGVWTTQFTVKKIGMMEGALLPGIVPVLT